MSNKIKLVLTNLLIAVAGIAGLYWVANKADNDIKERIDTVNESYEYSKGKIVDFKSYKGHSVNVRYKINNITYDFSGKWDKNPKGLGENDSIRFRYSKVNPELIITELENEY
jgi:hypothetical protein